MQTRCFTLVRNNFWFIFNNFKGLPRLELALFDLDNTLIGGDSDYLWGQFLVEQGVVERSAYEQQNKRFYAAYQQGTLDIHEFLRFQLQPLSEHDLETLHGWRDQFISEKILPIMLPAAKQLLQKHGAQGDTLIIITSTNRFVTTPIAEALGVNHLIATELELINDHYTGNVLGTPCYREGKIECLHNWLNLNKMSLGTFTCYSDSHNDLPLLKIATQAVAVDPDEILAEHAKKSGWPIISLR